LRAFEANLKSGWPSLTGHSLPSPDNDISAHGDDLAIAAFASMAFEAKNCGRRLQVDVEKWSPLRHLASESCTLKLCASWRESAGWLGCGRNAVAEVSV